MANVTRGIRLHESLLEKPDLPQTGVVQKKSVGRSQELIQCRNEALLHRFYFKSKVQRKIYPDILNELTEEFYISGIQIGKLLQSNGDRILELKKQAPDVVILKRKFPYMSW